jgi:hypothetical protein
VKLFLDSSMALAAALSKTGASRLVFDLADRRDCGSLLGQTAYGLQVLTPGEFLRTEREAGRLKT